MPHETSKSTRSSATPPRRPKPSPGRHGSGRAVATSAPLEPMPAVTQQPASSALASPSTSKPAPKKTRSKHDLTVPRSSQAVPIHSLLSLEDTISVATALTVLRGEAVSLHVETTGPNPLHDEVIAIHACRVRKHRTIAELSLKVLPLMALPAAAAEDGTVAPDRPPAKRQDVPLQEAVTRLLEFLGTHRQHVFVHGTAGAQAFLGQAARQYGMAIENPVGDVADLARLAWPGRADYSLSGLARDLLPELGPIRTSADATKAILGLLQAAPKVLAGNGGLVSKSIVHWGTSPDTIKLKQSPW